MGHRPPPLPICPEDNKRHLESLHCPSPRWHLVHLNNITSLNSSNCCTSVSVGLKYYLNSGEVRLYAVIIFCWTTGNRLNKKKAKRPNETVTYALDFTTLQVRTKKAVEEILHFLPCALPNIPFLYPTGWEDS